MSEQPVHYDLLMMFASESATRARSAMAKLWVTVDEQPDPDGGLQPILVKGWSLTRVHRLDNVSIDPEDVDLTDRGYWLMVSTLDPDDEIATLSECVAVLRRDPPQGQTSVVRHRLEFTEGELFFEPQCGARYDLRLSKE